MTRAQENWDEIGPRTRLILPIASAMAAMLAVGGGAWTLATMHADIRSQIRDLSTRSDFQYGQIGTRLTELTLKVDALNADQDRFLTQREFKTYIKHLRDLNEGADIRVPEVK